MVRTIVLVSYVALSVLPVLTQEIYDVWSTTWNQSSLFSYKKLPNAISFITPGAIGSADIVVNDGTLLQSMVGHGASLTDSSALLMYNLKNQNSNNYWSLLNTLFNPTDGANTAGLSYLRVPLGASDFSAQVYSFDDVVGDQSLAHFNINNAPPYLFSVIKDIQRINPYLKIHLVPWSPPGWMKDSGTMNGGKFTAAYSTVYANYLMKALQGFQSKGIDAYAISIQNEPENTDSTYPTCILTVAQEAQIGSALRALMNANGLSGVRIIGYDHNWNDAGEYPVQLMNNAANAFSGIAFHCYQGNVGQQDSFHNAWPNMDIHFTECTGDYGSDWWGDIKWYMDNIFVGAAEHYANSGLMWNLALDEQGKPMLPGTNSCNPPCRPIVTINSDGSFSYNPEFYAMAQTSKAVLPKDTNGPFGQRIAVTVGGTLSRALRVVAFVTARVNPVDKLRYSIVVLNWNDSPGGTWNPTPVTTTIEFRGMQATYTFPVGITTLWWYAPNRANKKRDNVTVAALSPDSTNSSSMFLQRVSEPNLKLFRFRRSAQ